MTYRTPWQEFVSGGIPKGLLERFAAFEEDAPGTTIPVYPQTVRALAEAVLALQELREELEAALTWALEEGGWHLWHFAARPLPGILTAEDGPGKPARIRGAKAQPWAGKE